MGGCREEGREERGETEGRGREEWEEGKRERSGRVLSRFRSSSRLSKFEVQTRFDEVKVLKKETHLGPRRPTTLHPLRHRVDRRKQDMQTNRLSVRLSLARSSHARRVGVHALQER